MRKLSSWVGWLKETSEQHVGWQGDPEPKLRWKLIASAAIFTFLLGWVGFKLLTSNFDTTDLPSSLVPDSGIPAATTSPSAE